MKFFAFTKLGFIRIVASSLMLSVYISAILLNFASRQITAGNFFATLVFIAVFGVFAVFAKTKNHPPLYKTAKWWLIVSIAISFVGFVVSSADAEIEGFIGTVLGWLVMIFVSPFYGFAYIFKSAAAVSIVVMIVSSLLLAVPSSVTYVSKRRKLMKKLK